MELVLSRRSTCLCEEGQMEVELVLSRRSFICEVGGMEVELVLYRQSSHVCVGGGGSNQGGACFIKTVI